MASAQTSASPILNPDPARPMTATSPPARFTAVNGDHAAPTTSRPESRRSSGSQGERNSEPWGRPNGHTELPPIRQQEPLGSTSPSNQKRKRSESLERRPEPTIMRSPEQLPPHARRDSTEQIQRMPIATTQASPQVIASAPYAPPADRPRPTPYPPRPYDEPQPLQAQPQHHQQQQQHYQHHQHQQQPQRQFETAYRTDAQIAEALQRESMNMDASQSVRAESMDDNASRGSAPRSQDYDGNRDKRRKRVFSNRTKTGCLTCRRRKKKCDEGKPECQACLKGGFLCESNHVSNTAPTTPANPPLPLQPVSSEDSQQVHHHSMPNGPRKEEPEREPEREREREPERAVHTPQAPAHFSPSQMAAHAHREERRQTADQSIRPPTGYWGQTAYSASPQYQAENAHRQSSTESRPSRREPSATPPSALPRRPMTHPNTRSPQMQQQAQAAHAQVQAQMALQHPAARRPVVTEKEKMLAGQLYFATDATLVAERERAKAACFRFNSSNNPNVGVSPEERARLFRKIVEPDEQALGYPKGSSRGHVGDKVVVEAPLSCDYGYNITIGDESLIGANCTMMDTCPIKIGKRCIIGPNVSLFTATLPVDPRRRKGSQGPSMGKGITIEDDCWLGGNVVVLPGLTISRSSVIGAGSVVTRDVPSFTVWGGNPARCLRGIYSNDISND
ncbi:MAG: Maltose acetyltransferase [Vezdaea aestivalis]|nr:MAG: Maltose acetyltransferase [Vezdaea aestivalis]